MKTIIFGACENGIRVKRNIAENITAYCDNNRNKQGLILDGLPIISVEEVIRLSLKEKIRVICASIGGLEILANQLRINHSKIELFGVSLRFLREKTEFIRDFSEEIFPICYDKPRLDYFEYHVAWQCNLRCKGCGHKSNIYHGNRMGDYDKYKKDICRLKELFWGVKRIRLMGGEPLLNDKLSDFILETRKIFPDSDIRIVTNGLLIPDIKGDLYETMRKTGAEFDISQYPPTKEKKEEIEIKCINERVGASFSPVVESFFSNVDVEGNQDVIKSYNKCKNSMYGSSGCHFLLDGCISMCGVPILHRENGDDYALDTKEDIIDIYDSKITGDRILELFSQPIISCKYCDWDNLKFFDWEGHSKITIEKC